MTLTSKAQRFKSKFITAELANLFSQSDSEEEFQGFSDDDEEEEERSDCFGKWLEDKTESEDSAADTGFYSDGDDEPPPKRQSLCVALKFPTKRLSTPKPELSEKKKTNVKKQTRAAPPPRRSSERKKVEAREEKEERDNEDEDEEDEEEEVVPQSLRKRDKNISENKAMLAKLFADLTTMAELSSLSTPQQKKKPSSRKTTPRKRKFEPESGAERRNPSRKARPPENFAVEERSASPGRGERRLKTVDIRRLVEVDEEQADGCRKKRRGYASKKCRYVVKSVEDISPEELENVAYRSKDKIWDKENGSSCHQCRQKTLDTKTVCRSGMCVGGKGQFCGPCLKNRYGEDVCTVLLDPAWSCPICRGVCNCSLCRKKEGRCATGILVGLARYNGHDNVHKYLESIQKELQ